jgi:hypothetical protein
MEALGGPVKANAILEVLAVPNEPRIRNMNFKTLTLLSSLVITVFAAPSPQTVDSLLINTP